VTTAVSRIQNEQVPSDVPNRPTLRPSA
jgi:hypothetical protein